MFPGFVSSVCKAYYTGVLVHSDPVVCRIEKTFERTDIIEPPIIYTGFVCKEKSNESVNRKTAGVVASFGGGAVGFPMAQLIIQAFSKHGFGTGVPLKVIAGPLFPEEQYQELLSQAQGIEGLSIVRYVDNLIVELSHAAASISQCGYNTTMELLQTGVPALVIPYENETNSEQVLRAKMFSDLSLLRYVRFADITPSALADEVKKTLEFKPDRTVLDLNGAEHTKRILMDMYNDYYTHQVLQ
jgi:predicted glycosyltransferase